MFGFFPALPAPRVEPPAKDVKAMLLRLARSYGRGSFLAVQTNARTLELAESVGFALVFGTSDDHGGDASDSIARADPSDLPFVPYAWDHVVCLAFDPASPDASRVLQELWRVARCTVTVATQDERALRDLILDAWGCPTARQAPLGDFTAYRGIKRWP